jgi:hypothetical protein
MNEDTKIQEPQGNGVLPCVKLSYSLEEVRILLEEQKKRMCFSLGLSSRTFHYPTQYDDIVEWMMRCPLVV